MWFLFCANALSCRLKSHFYGFSCVALHSSNTWKWQILLLYGFFHCVFSLAQILKVNLFQACCHKVQKETGHTISWVKSTFLQGFPYLGITVSSKRIWSSDRWLLEMWPNLCLHKRHSAMVRFGHLYPNALSLEF